MISWINGQIISSWQITNKFFILINCRGLGYEIQINESLFIKIKNNSVAYKDINLWLRHIKKEDSDLLFGFLLKDQRDFFNEILNIKGIGSQIGMSLLNKFTLKNLMIAIENNDKKSISSIQGIGQKMTERIILELKNKTDPNLTFKSEEKENEFLKKNPKLNSLIQDIEMTLQSLNYSKKEIRKVIPILIENIRDESYLKKDKINIGFEHLLKVAIDLLSKNSSNICQ